MRALLKEPAGQRTKATLKSIAEELIEFPEFIKMC